MSLGEEGGFCPNPIDPAVLLGDLACRFGFRLRALSALFSLKTCLCNQQRTTLELADRIRKVHMSVALKEVVDGKRRWQGRGDLVRRGKGGADITASIPDHLGMIFQVQQ